MAFRPYKNIPATVNVPLSTVAVVRGQVLTRVGDGSLTDSIAITTVLPIQFVAAETVDNSSGTATTSCLAYPVTDQVCWEAVLFRCCDCHQCWREVHYRNQPCCWQRDCSSRWWFSHRGNQERFRQAGYRTVH